MPSTKPREQHNSWLYGLYAINGADLLPNTPEDTIAQLI